MTIVRRTGRILSLLGLAFILTMFVGEALADGGPFTLRWHEAIGLLLFPIGVTAGNLLGWWRERAGAITTFASLVAFYLWDVIVTGTPPGGPFFALVALPCVFYAVVGFWGNGDNARSNRQPRRTAP